MRNSQQQPLAIRGIHNKMHRFWSYLRQIYFARNTNTCILYNRDIIGSQGLSACVPQTITAYKTVKPWNISDYRCHNNKLTLIQNISFSWVLFENWEGCRIAEFKTYTNMYSASSIVQILSLFCTTDAERGVRTLVFPHHLPRNLVRYVLNKTWMRYKWEMFKLKCTSCCITLIIAQPNILGASEHLIIENKSYIVSF